METDKFKNDLMIGETSSIEFKRCGNETVSLRPSPI